MRAFWCGLILIVVLAVAARSRYGTQIGTEVRYLSDRLMLGFLRATSEFERDADKP